MKNGAGEPWENTFEIVVQEELTEEDRRRRNGISNVVQNVHDNAMEIDMGTMGWGLK